MSRRLPRRPFNLILSLMVILGFCLIEGCSFRVKGESLRTWFSTLRQAPNTGEAETPRQAAPQKKSVRRWYIDVGLTQSYTLLHESRDDIDLLVNTPVRWLGVDRSDVRTFQDWRRDGMILTGLFGVGYHVNDWLSIGVRGGGSAGRQENDRNLVLGKLEADFEYGAVFAEVYASIYPVGRPVYLPEREFVDVLSDGSPFFWQALSVSRFTSKGDVRFPLGPVGFRNVVEREDFTAGYHVGLGWDWAISPRWNLQVVGNYNFYADRPREFNGYSANILFAYSLDW